MKNKILLGVVVILSLINIVVICTKKTDHSFFNEEEEKKITVKTSDNQLENLNLEDYLIGVLAAEIPASFHEEALKAQAVASRTYALYKIKTNKNENYDILADISNQAYITKEEMKEKWQEGYDHYLEKITKAVNETKNEAMFYHDEIIESFYFSMSNGYTEDASFVFSESLPYIKSVSSKWDNESLNNFEVTTTFSKEDFCTKLGIANCQDLTMNNKTYTNTHRINTITINNQEFKGTEIRKKLNLRSTDFTIDLKDTITITTKGYGHGVGMSQYGANGMAKEGFNYKEILNHYYKDISIKKIV